MFSDEFSPLEGLRVLDLSDEKGELCGRILGDLGADVLKIEPSNGTVSRTLGPFAPDGTSLYFAYRNLNKRSASIDFDTTEGVDDLFALIKQKSKPSYPEPSQNLEYHPNFYFLKIPLS